MSSAALGIGLPSIDSTRPVTQVVSPSTVAPLVKSAPYSNSGAPCTKNGPSTGGSVAPGGLLRLRPAPSNARAGALLEGDRKILDLQAAHSRVYHGSSPLLESVLAIAEAGSAALDVADQLIRNSSDATTHDRADVRLLAPIPCPPQMRDFLCFEKHLLQAFQAIGKKPPQAWYERPLFYHPNRFSVCGPDAEVPWPSYSESLDYELEFVCYIGKPGKDITKEKAREHIFGYTIFNDFSARDEQGKEMEIGRASCRERV